MEIDALADAVREATTIVAVGHRTQWEVGNSVAPDATEVRAPSGVITYEPGDLTITIGAGTTEAELTAVVGEHRQECALDPRSDRATVGGILATGLSGYRRLRHGPLRDRVRFITAEGELVKGGGPTVKNVSGFDIPRLMVGSLGTIGVLTQVTLRCQPVDRVTEWTVTSEDPVAVLRGGYRPSCALWNGHETRVLVEGVTADVEAERLAMATAAGSSAPDFPAGPHRGRISVRPSALFALAPALDAAGVRWLAEVGVGTVHVAADAETDLAAARAAAESAGGWLLREAGVPGLDGFGIPLPKAALQERIRAAFDPGRKLSPGRMG